ncbi:MAG: radical SAM protein [Oscillospiraceae bacterium]|nr:radical SAM protein [Oscillospiraceae bacterium]
MNVSKNVYYGIQGEFVKKNISKWVNITGKPEVFAVKDESLKNFSKGFLGYEVVSVDEVIERYPEAQFWITYNNDKTAKSAGNYLLKKAQPEKIHFLEADLEYRKSCKRLGSTLYYRGSKFPLCIMGRRTRPCFIAEDCDSVRDVIIQWQSYVEKLIEANQCESPNRCFGCHAMEYGFFHKTIRCRNVLFLQDLAMDACNFKCIYCTAAKSGALRENKKRVGTTTYDIVRTFSEMPDYVALKDNFIVTFANGELCVNRYFDEIMEVLFTTEWKIALLSNLSVYREKLALLIEAGRVPWIISSIDAGTRETFKKIKGNDKFYKVVENLKRYPMSKTRLKLQYNLLEGINDNKTDADGFFEIAKNVGAEITLSQDLHKNAIPFSEVETMREIALRLIRKAKADGIIVGTSQQHNNPIDIKFVKESYANMVV